jgi:superfamily II DNA/RNA helicase
MFSKKKKSIFHFVYYPYPDIYFSIHRVGRNVAAGMTGGLAYILDEDDTLVPKVHELRTSNHLPSCSVACMH